MHELALARLVSLHQGRPGIADGTGCEAAAAVALNRQGGSRVMEGAVPLRPHLRTSTTRSVKGLSWVSLVASRLGV